MFFSLILENSAGDKIDMTATANQYMTSKIEGLSPPPGTISTSSYAGMDGSYLNNAFIEKRNVVIHFEMRGVGVEARRHQLYKVMKPSRYVNVYYKTAGIDVFTEGYVETCEVRKSLISSLLARCSSVSFLRLLLIIITSEVVSLLLYTTLEVYTNFWIDSILHTKKVLKF